MRANALAAGLTTPSAAAAARFGEVPVHQDAVGLVPDVDPVREFAVEVRVEGDDRSAELREVEVRISPHERIEGPGDRVDPPLQAPGSLVHLQREADGPPLEPARNARD